MIITIDGPAGSGKSTISRIIAKKLGYTYINSGAIYRAITYWILSFDANENNIDKINIDKIIEKSIIDMNKLKLEYIYNNEILKILLNKKDITNFLKQEKISKFVSLIAKNEKIRNFVIEIEKNVAKKNNVILEGRDSGTVVFPFAEKKFFLIANIDERVNRRFLELINLGEIKKNANFVIEKQKIKSLIISRDENDKNRKISPLKKPIDAIEIDTTGKTIHEVVEILEKNILGKN